MWIIWQKMPTYLSKLLNITSISDTWGKFLVETFEWQMKLLKTPYKQWCLHERHLINSDITYHILKPQEQSSVDKLKDAQTPVLMGDILDTLESYWSMLYQPNQMSNSYQPLVLFFFHICQLLKHSFCLIFFIWQPTI